MKFQFLEDHCYSVALAVFFFHLSYTCRTMRSLLCSVAFVIDSSPSSTRSVTTAGRMSFNVNRANSIPSFSAFFLAHSISRRRSHSKT